MIEYSGVLDEIKDLIVSFFTNRTNLGSIIFSAFLFLRFVAMARVVVLSVRFDLLRSDSRP